MTAGQHGTGTTTSLQEDHAGFNLYANPHSGLVDAEYNEANGCTVQANFSKLLAGTPLTLAANAAVVERFGPHVVTIRHKLARNGDDILRQHASPRVIDDRYHVSTLDMD